MFKKIIGIAVLIIAVLILAGGARKWKTNHPIINNAVSPISNTAPAQSSSTLPANKLLKNFKLLQSNSAAHSFWSPSDPNLLVIDKADSTQYYQLYYLKTDGELLSSLTKGHPDITQRNNGWPEWDPKDQYIVFQSEEPEHFQDNLKWLAFPGLGFYSNLWATDIKGGKFWKLTNVQYANTNIFQLVRAVVNPMFSSGGDKLYWTERYARGGYLNWGKWQVKQADFVRSTDGPKLANEKVVLRAEDVCSKCNYVVNMGIYSDGSTMVVAGNLDGQHVYGMDQYLLNLNTKKLTNLTNTTENWEEGSCLSPDNKQIVYSTDIDSALKLDFDDADWSHQPKEKEYWIMNSDGSAKQRLTYFNKPGLSEYSGMKTITAECAFSPSGNKFAGIVGYDKSTTPTKTAFELNVGLFEF